MPIVGIAAVLHGTADLTASLTGVFQLLAAFSGGGDLTAPCQASRFAAAELEGEGTVVAFATSPLIAVLSGTADLGASAQVVYDGRGAFSGAGDLVALGHATYPGSSFLSGSADLVGGARVAYSGSAALDGESNLVAAALGENEMAADLSGSATLVGSLFGSLLVEATLDGEASVTAYGLVRKPFTAKATPSAVLRPRPPKVLEDPHYTIESTPRRRNT